MSSAFMSREEEGPKSTDLTVQAMVVVPPDAVREQRDVHEDVTVTAAPEVMRALGIPPRFEIDEKLLAVLSLPPTPLPPRSAIPMPVLPPIETPITIPVVRRSSRPSTRPRIAMSGAVVAIWTLAAVLFGVLFFLVRSTS